MTSEPLRYSSSPFNTSSLKPRMQRPRRSLPFTWMLATPIQATKAFCWRKRRCCTALRSAPDNFVHFTPLSQIQERSCWALCEAYSDLDNSVSFNAKEQGIARLEPLIYRPAHLFSPFNFHYSSATLLCRNTPMHLLRRRMVARPWIWVISLRRETGAQLLPDLPSAFTHLQTNETARKHKSFSIFQCSSCNGASSRAQPVPLKMVMPLNYCSE